jgi:hypothetical protein
MMNPAVRDFLESLKGNKKLTAAELEAALPNSNLMKMQADPDKLADMLKKFSEELKKLSDADKKIADEALVLLSSQNLNERVRGTEMVFDHLYKIFSDAALAKGKQLSPEQLTAECLGKFGPESLRLNPVIEHLYQLYLWRQRPKPPIAFDEWLKVSDSERLPTICVSFSPLINSASSPARRRCIRLPPRPTSSSRRRSSTASWPC